MEILQAGAQLLSNAQQKLDVTSHKIVREPLEAKNLIDLHVHSTEAKVGAKLIERGKELNDHLLDVLG